VPTDVEVVLANNAAFNRRDLDAMLAFYAPDADVVDHRHLGAMGDQHGHAGLRAYYGSIFDNTTEIEENLEVLADGNGMVVARCRTVAGLASDVGTERMEFSYGMVLHMRDGLIQTLDLYDDGPAALAASGLGASTPPASA
jgi:ketosteroid isomerase-like protein